MTTRLLFLLVLFKSAVLPTIFCLYYDYRQDGLFTIEYDDKKDSNSLPVPEMVKQYGFSIEIHKVTTKDGYINTLHRLIPPVDSIVERDDKPVIFVQHGLFGTSADFLMGRPNKSLGYILAEKGYDVWLGNCRGNKYSREHLTFNVESRKYWRFSFDEMGKYDIPAAVAHITNVTEQDRIYYLGHSMGTIMFWIALQEHPYLNDRIRSMVALAPVARVTHILSPIRHLAHFSRDFEFLFKLLGITEFNPTNRVLEFFNKWLCDLTTFQKEICENVIFLMAGYDYRQMNQTLLPIILGHEPGGTSTRTLIHFAQEIEARKFQKYDHGYRKNKKFYNRTTPPEYTAWKNIRVPIALLWSDNDWLADPTDVSWLKEKLQNLIRVYEVPYKKFNHVDFLWGLDADKLVYPIVLDILRST